MISLLAPPNIVVPETPPDANNVSFGPATISSGPDPPEIVSLPA